MIVYEGIVYALMAGYPVMGAAIALLYRNHMKTVNELLSAAKEHEKTLSTFVEYVKSRKRNKEGGRSDDV